MPHAAIKYTIEELREEIATLNTTSNYRQFAEQVFPFNLHLLIPHTLDWKRIANNITLVKAFFTGNPMKFEHKDFLKTKMATILHATLINIDEGKKK